MTKGHCIVDSGTSLIVGSEEFVAPIVDGITVNQDCSGTDKLPNITITLDSKDYVLKSEDYVIKVCNGSQCQCMLGI